jgi:hypothetical protein
VLGAKLFEARIRHLDVTARAAEFNPALVAAVAHIGAALEPVAA